MPIILILRRTTVFVFIWRILGICIQYFSEWSLKIVHNNGTVISTSPVGASCSPSSDSTQEKCARPVIKECVDRNIYCTDPPEVSK